MSELLDFDEKLYKNKGNNGIEIRRELLKILGSHATMSHVESFVFKNKKEYHKTIEKSAEELKTKLKKILKECGNPAEYLLPDELKRLDEIQYRLGIKSKAEENVRIWEDIVKQFTNGKYLGWEDYTNDISIRTIIQRGYDELSPAMKKRVEAADKKFRKIFVPGNPQVNEEYQKKHPKEVYWWLYGEPKNRPKDW